MTDEFWLELEERRKHWTAAIETKGHTPIMTNGELDIFAGGDVDGDGLHNGPACATCGWSCCWHCDGIDKIPECLNPQPAD